MAHRRGDDRRQHHRHKARHGVLADDHFHGENHPGEGGIEGGGNATSGAAGDQYAQAGIGQAQTLADDAVDGRAQVYAGSLATAGLPRGQRHHAAEELYDRIAHRQHAVVQVEAADDVNDSHVTVFGLQGRERRAQDQRTRQRQREPLQCG